MNTEERFQDLLNRFIEGELSDAEGNELAGLLRDNPGLAESMQDKLIFADLLEQILTPCRSFEAFVNGLETRFQAEETADEFVAELIPKLKELDQRRGEPVPAETVIAFPQPSRQPQRRPRKATIAWSAALAAAAALALIAVVGQGWHPNPNSRGVAKLAQTEDVVWAAPEGEDPAIEWEVGASVNAGEHVRLASGRARFEFDNGNMVTVEGPADIRFKSNSEGYLLHGSMMAAVAKENAPFRLHAPAMQFDVQGAATGIRTLDGNRLEASVLSEVGILMAQAKDGTRKIDAIGPQESVVTKPEDGLLEVIPFDLEPYRGHLALMAGIAEHSDGIQLNIGNVSPDSPSKGAIQISLERDNVETGRDLPVDIAPGRNLPLAHTETLKLEERPVIPGKERLRSYIVRLDEVQPAAGGEDYVEAFVTFDQPILGVAATNATLNQGDTVTGAPSDETGTRGLLAADQVRISEDGHTLILRIKASQRQDLSQFRIFVKARKLALPRAPDEAWAGPLIEREEKPDLSGSVPAPAPAP